ncbi:MAG: HEPN domain-containing protein [Candidatus Thorarchaeota archaeon]
MKGNPLNEAHRWLTQAEDELNDAKFLFENKRYYLVLYLCQQAAEKALKAFLIAKGETHLITHSVRDLLEFAIEIDKSLDVLKAAKRLDDYYIPTRYPNGLPGGIPSRYFDDPQETQAALTMSESVVVMVRKFLNTTPST